MLILFEIQCAFYFFVLPNLDFFLRNVAIIYHATEQVRGVVLFSRYSVTN